MVLAPPFSAVNDPLWTPRGPSVPLTLSGNEQTPYTRRFGREGDGLNPNELLGKYSLGVWEATTNLVINGGFETNTTGHAGNAGTETVSRITTDSKFGAACGSFVTPGNATGEGWRTNSIAISAATAYAASFWYKAPAGALVIATFQSRDGADAFISNITTSGNIVASGDWDRITLAGTSDASAANTRITITTRTSAQAITIKIDGVQLEAQPLATPYVHTDGATAARTAARVQLPNIRRYLNETQGWVALLVNMGWGTTTEPSSFITPFRWFDDGNNQLQVYYDSSANTLYMFRIASSVGTSDSVAFAPAIGETHLIVATWTATELGIALNGNAVASLQPDTNIPTLTATSADIGTSQSGANHIDSNILFAALGRGRLTSANLAAINNIARNNRIDSRPEDLPGGCTAKWPPADGDISRMLVAA